MENLAALKPVDRTAKNVVSPGFQYSPDKVVTQPHFEVCPPMRPAPGSRDGTFVDLTGTKFGRFVVLGVYDAPRNKNTVLTWVCRCACGHYETRKTKAVRNPANADDCCAYCQHLKYLKRKDREGFAGPKGKTPCSK